MTERIQQELNNIERKNNLKILFACESGSRAWGFPSEDSDYDVRFIYVRPIEWYLSIDDHKDTLDFPINDLLDINGWDIRKALKLFRSSNPVIYEWLQSPIVYKEELDFQNRMNLLFNDFFSLRTGMHHYLGMTLNAFNNDLQGEEVRLKKYFYALRPSLACRWMAVNKTVPPMEFDKLRALIANEEELNKLIDRLLEQKHLSKERDTVSPARMLHHFIQNEIREAELFSYELEKKIVDTEVLDKLFRQFIKESF